MKTKLFKRISSTIASLLLATTLAVSAPISVASAAEVSEENASVSNSEAKKEGLGEFFDIFNAIFDTKFTAILSDINWDSLFNSDVNWAELFKGNVSFAEVVNTGSAFSEILNIIRNFVGDSKRAEAILDLLEKIVESEYFERALNRLLQAMDNVVKGDDSAVKDMLEEDFESLSVLLSKDDYEKYLDDIIEKYPQLKDLFNGDYSFIEKLVSGDYSFLQQLLDGDLSFLGQFLNPDSEYMKAILAKDYKALVELLEIECPYAEYILNEDFEGLVALLGEDCPYAEGLLKGDFSAILALLSEDCPSLKVFLEENYSWITELVNGDLTGLLNFLNTLDYEKLGIDKEKVNINAILEFVSAYLPELQAMIKGESSLIENIKNGDYSALTDLFKQICELANFDYTTITGTVLDYLPSLSDNNIVVLVKALLNVVSSFLPEEMQAVIDDIFVVIDKADEVIDEIIEQLGDLNNDSEVSMVDVVVTQRIIADMNQGLSAEQIDMADVNRDGEVSMLDVVLMQRYVAKMIISF